MTKVIAIGAQIRRGDREEGAKGGKEGRRETLTWSWPQKTWLTMKSHPCMSQTALGSTLCILSKRRPAVALR